MEEEGTETRLVALEVTVGAAASPSLLPWSKSPLKGSHGQVGLMAVLRYWLQWRHVCPDRSLAVACELFLVGSRFCQDAAAGVVAFREQFWGEFGPRKCRDARLQIASLHRECRSSPCLFAIFFKPHHFSTC